METPNMCQLTWNGFLINELVLRISMPNMFFAKTRRSIQWGCSASLRICPDRWAVGCLTVFSHSRSFCRISQDSFLFISSFSFHLPDSCNRISVLCFMQPAIYGRAVNFIPRCTLVNFMPRFSYMLKMTKYDVSRCPAMNKSAFCFPATQHCSTWLGGCAVSRRAFQV